MREGAVTFLVAAMAALMLCALFRRVATAAGWLAYPDARSSHREPTVSGAGLALVSALLLSLFLVGPPLPLAALVLLAFSALLSFVGLLDDRLNLSAHLRLLLYASAALTTALWLHAPPLSLPAWLAVASAALWILAFCNLFNFMDGIDALAALQSISAALLLGVFASLGGAGDWYIALCFALAGASAGFLYFNRPPAVLFMGDAGSIPTGYLLASLILAGWWLENIPVPAGLILLALFLADSITTLVFRMAEGEALMQAHRRHLYQRLARRWDSHGRVGALFLLVQWLWLAPLALAATLMPAFAALICALAYLPLLIAMVKMRSIR